MSRKLASRKQIATHLTNEIRKLEDCEGLSIGSVVPLRSPDTDGCNWSPDVIVSTGGVPQSHFGPYLGQIIIQARSMFNLIDD
jgi:hypothetical protein